MNIIKNLTLSLFLPTSLYATDIIKVATYNICVMDRVEEGWAREILPLHRANARQDAIVHTVDTINKSHNPNIWLFQEGCRYTNKLGEEVDNITKLEIYLESSGYEVHSCPYKLDHKPGIYLSAFKKDRFQLMGTDVWYFTQDHLPTETPVNDSSEELEKMRDRNFGELHERSTFVLHLTDKRNSDILHLCNIHLGLSKQVRLESCKLLNTFSQEFLRSAPFSRVIMGGDFNTFPDWGGPEMLDIILLQDATKELCLYEKGQCSFMNSYDSTIFMYPFDFASKEEEFKNSDRLTKFEEREAEDRGRTLRQIYAHECAARGGHLDHIFTYGFCASNIGEAMVHPVPLFPEEAPSDYTEEEVKNYVLENYDRGPAFASDHQPVVAYLLPVTSMGDGKSTFNICGATVVGPEYSSIKGQDDAIFLLGQEGVISYCSGPKFGHDVYVAARKTVFKK